MNRFMFGFVVTLLLFILGACAPVTAPPATPTSAPPTATTIPTNPPTAVPPTATSSPTPVPPTATSSPSLVPPTDTPTATPVPPTATATIQPTNTLPPPTATLPPPTATKAAPKPTAVPATAVPQPTSPPSSCPLDPGNAGILVVNDFDAIMTFTVLNHEYKVDPHSQLLVQVPGDTNFTASVSVPGVGKTNFGPVSLATGQCAKYEPHAG